MVFNLILVFQIILFGKPSSKPLLASAYSPMQYEYWPWVQECCAPWRREGPHGANALLSAGTAQCTIWPRISCSSCCSFQMSSNDQSTCADHGAHRDGCRFCISQGGPLLHKEDVLKKRLSKAPPPHISGCTMGPKCCLCPVNNRSGTPLPYFEVAGCEKRDCRDTQIVTHTICNIRMHQNLPFFHEKTAKNGRFSVKN